MEVIVCRSSEQIYEDNLCELHTRLTRWTKELANERCFSSSEVARKRDKLTRMQTLIDSVEDAMINSRHIDINVVELRGIRTSSMLHP